MIKKTIGKIRPIDRELMSAAQERLDNLTKPQGSLGRLEELAKQVVGITGKRSPRLEDKVIFTLAADHGVTDEGVSAFPKEVTVQMVYNFLKDGAGINVLANHVGARVVVADIGVAADIGLKADPRFVSKKIGRGTKNMTQGPAMTRREAEQSICAGIELFGRELKDGLDIAGTGEMGIGNTTASSAITAVFTGKQVREVTGRGTGIDDKAFEHKVKVIERALGMNVPKASDPIGVLSAVGGFEIGGLSGIILAAAAKRVPVVIDGFISGAAALVAYALEPKVRDYMIASHCSVERGHKAILEHIGLRPILDLDLRLGEGTGAALGISIVEASVKILTQMATFKSANVSRESKT